MTDPQALAQQRQQAIEQLQEQLSTHVDEAQRVLLEGLLAQLKDLHTDPGLLPVLLADYQRTIAAPLAAYYASQVLSLPALSEPYFAELGVAGYSRLRQPLEAYLRQRLGLNADGVPLPGGYVDLLAADTTAQRQLVQYAYSAQAAGVGLNAYRQGLTELVVGTGGAGQGLMQQLYKQSYDDLNRADRVLQKQAAERLGLTAYLYQGGLIASSRPFCKVRNGNVFLDWEIALFGTSEDAFGGYSDKKAGLFSGKSEPYEPLVDCGGYNCRHGLHPIPALVAKRLRPELEEDKDGKLYLKTT